MRIDLMDSLHISTCENLLLKPLDNIRRSYIWGLETETLTELYHLRNLGYVDLKQREGSINTRDPLIRDQFSDQIKVTEAGKKYIELREERA
jgi:hypothetical protein